MTTPHWQLHPGQGPYLLMVHGLLSGTALWSDNLAALSRVCQPITVELFGHGRSPSPEDPADYDPATYVNAFEALRSELGAREWFLLGQSLGAGITLRYALAHPERIRAHLMTNSSTAFGDRAWLRARRPFFDRLLPEVERHGRAALEALAIHPRQARRLDPACQARLCAQAARNDPRGVALSVAHTIPRAACGEHLGENRVPTLLLCGIEERSFVTGRRHAERHMPHLEIVEIPAGHAVNAEAPAAFNRAAVAFLRRFA